MHRSAGLFALAAAVAAALIAACAGTGPGAAPGANDIAGTVSGPSGPEAGVWVIAETTELPTKYAKVVVTDDAGRYVIPELPKAEYSVWVRGYGLVDSPKVSAHPGQTLALTATVAPSAKAAAEYYPGM
ncbi:MAG TPA: carboxypeptidase-like regulatory domain-containing protein, partial [Burkholderiales bacterium]